MHKVMTFLFTLLFLLPLSGQAIEIEGVKLPEVIQLEHKTMLLNGAGIRTKFFFDIYVAGLYLEQRSSSAHKIIHSNTSRRFSMDILYDEVARERLTNGWEQGFRKNQPDEKMRALHERLDRFNALFVTAHKGDRIVFDFLSDGSTRVQINGITKGAISGTDFQQALLETSKGDSCNLFLFGDFFQIKRFDTI